MFVFYYYCIVVEFIFYKMESIEYNEISSDLLERHQRAVFEILINSHIQKSKIKNIYLKGDYDRDIDSYIYKTTTDIGSPRDYSINQDTHAGKVIWKLSGSEGEAGCYVNMEDDSTVIILDSDKMKSIDPDLDDVPRNLHLELHPKYAIDKFEPNNQSKNQFNNQSTY